MGNLWGHSPQRNLWGHSPQNKTEMEVRIHCGKFSIKNNRIEYQSFLPFVNYSEIPRRECPHFSQGVVAVECGNATNLRESIGEDSRSACIRGRIRGVQAPRIGSARQPRRTSPCRKALRRRHPGFALPMTTIPGESGFTRGEQLLPRDGEKFVVVFPLFHVISYSRKKSSRNLLDVTTKCSP